MAAKKKAPEELRIEYLPLSDLISRKDPDNAKLHDLPELEASFRKFGFVAPAAIEETTGLLLFGHGRIDELAGLKAEGAKPPKRIRVEGDEWLVPVIRGIRLGKKLGSLYRFADNAIGEGLWDRGQLAKVIVAAVGKNLEELDGTGISPAFASQIIAHFIEREEEEAGPKNTEEVERIRKKWKTKLGDLYELRAHRLLVGDSTDGEAVERLYAGETASAVLTDPPYGIMQDGVLNDDPKGIRDLYSGAITNFPVEKGVVAAFQSPRLELLMIWLEELRSAGYKLERLLWMYRRQRVGTFPWRGWLLCSDAIVIGSKGRPRWPRIAKHSHDTYLREGKGNEDDLDGVHPTVKPKEFFVDLLSKLPFGIVFDPFLGSGTTMAAAEESGRSCYGIEIDPGYAAVVLERMSKYGIEPKKLPR
jgi:hypothetical protein